MHDVTVLFSFLEPEQLAQQLMEALKSVQITPIDVKEWKMTYSATKSDPDGNLIPDVSCVVQLRIFKV